MSSKCTISVRVSDIERDKILAAYEEARASTRYELTLSQWLRAKLMPEVSRSGSGYIVKNTVVPETEYKPF